MVGRDVVAALGLTLVACGVGDPPEGGRTRAGVNGSVDSLDEYSMVVGVRVNKGGAIARCSGVLIAPNLVLTARHCVSPVPGGLVECGSSALGTPYPAENAGVTRLFQMSDQTEDYVFGTRVEVVPGGDDTCGFDLAALVLDGDGFGTDAKVAVPRIDLSVSDGEEHTAVGYGSTGTSGIGTRRFKTGLAAYCVGTACPLPVPASEWVGAKDSFCQADSGAPALDVNGKLIGIVSRGQDPCATPILANIAEWKSWIMELGLSAAGDAGYAPPFWAVTGSSDPPPESDAGPSAQGSPCPCSAGFVCLSSDGTQENGTCAKTCSAHSECGSGLECGAESACVPTKSNASSGSDEDGGCSLTPAGQHDGNRAPFWFGYALMGVALSRRRRRFTAS